MTDYKNHIIAGLLLAIFIFVIFTLVVKRFFTITMMEIVYLTIIIILFSVLPDIDNRASQITWIILGVGALIMGMFMVNHFWLYTSFINLKWLIIGCLMVFGTFITLLLTKHRGVTHTMWFVFLAPFVLYFILPTNFWLYYTFGAVALYSHMLADKLLFPLSLYPK